MDLVELFTGVALGVLCYHVFLYRFLNSSMVQKFFKRLRGKD